MSKAKAWRREMRERLWNHGSLRSGHVLYGTKYERVRRQLKRELRNMGVVYSRLCDFWHFPVCLGHSIGSGLF